MTEDNRYSVEVRPAGQEDIDGLLVVERQCFNVYYYAYYMLDRRDFEYYLEDSDCIVLAAILNDRLVGYTLGPVELWRKPPAAHIDSIAVLPEVQHKGFGSRLLRSFMLHARQQGCEVVTLEVSTANEAGLAFFTRHGFQNVRRMRNYYGKGLHGLLMAAPIRPVKE